MDRPAGPHAGRYHSMNVAKDGASGSLVRPLTRTLPYNLSQNEFLHQNVGMKVSPPTGSQGQWVCGE